VGIDQERAVAERMRMRRQMRTDRRLSGPALARSNRDDIHACAPSVGDLPRKPAVKMVNERLTTGDDPRPPGKAKVGGSQPSGRRSPPYPYHSAVPTGPDPITSGDDGNTRLFPRLFRGTRLCRQLQHGRVLTGHKLRQHHDIAAREFQGIVVCMALMLLDLTEAGDAGRNRPTSIAVEVIKFDVTLERHFGTRH